MVKIVFFDCDETIWTSPTKDYISHVVSDLKPISKNELIRVADGLIYTLKPGIRKLFAKLNKEGIVVGFISDNKRKPVIKALKLFGLIGSVHSKATVVKLWKGYCPKHEMLLVVLKKSEFKDISKNDVLWIDDKDYSREAERIGVKFVKLSPQTDIYKKVYDKLKS